MVTAIRKNQMKMLDIRNTITQIRKISFTGLLKEPKKEESVSTVKVNRS